MAEPTLLKSLKLLRETRGSLTREDIIEKIGEAKDYVEKALEKLVESNIVHQDGGFYSYRNTPTNEEFSQKILAVYSKVTKKRERELVVVGLLSMSTQYRYLLGVNTLLKLLDDAEGFDSREVNSFLEGEMKDEKVIKIRVALMSKNEVSLPVPALLSFYYIDRLVQVEANENEYERVKKKWIDSGFFIQEEDYLAADYPDEVAIPAEECLDREMGHIKDRLKQEVFRWPSANWPSGLAYSTSAKWSMWYR